MSSRPLAFCVDSFSTNFRMSVMLVSLTSKWLDACCNQYFHFENQSRPLIRSYACEYIESITDLHWITDLSVDNQNFRSLSLFLVFRE